MDEIAGRAHAGKPTIYARFPTKEALFTAVVMRSLANKIARFEGYEPTGETIEERLASVGATVLHWALVGDTIGLLRLAIAEARRFPDLASRVYRMARERAAEAVARLLSEARTGKPRSGCASFEQQKPREKRRAALRRADNGCDNGVSMPSTTPLLSAKSLCEPDFRGPHSV
jgi:AcrR family transcriptional regulator